MMMRKASNILRYTYSTCLLIFSITLVSGLISSTQTTLSHMTGPVANYIILITFIWWLSVVEGGQASLVGLRPIDQNSYKESHPITLRATSVCYEGDNLSRYLLGRQFMVVLIVFVINIAGGSHTEIESFWGVPEWIRHIFLTSGLAKILITCMVGQLSSQINASHCMLDFINNYFALFTFYIAMAIEFSGLLHSSYVVQMVVMKIADKKIDSSEGARTRNMRQKIFFWGRCLLSLAALGFCTFVTIFALYSGKTTVWKGLPASIALLLFVVFVSIVGMLEGMQVAFYAVSKLNENERGSSVFAKKTCEILFVKDQGRNLPAFMIGRQLCVVSCMFFVARVTSIHILDSEMNLFGVPDGIQMFFNTGLLGALLLTILGSNSWQLVASAFPLSFVANPMTYILLRVCLFLESTGICAGAWLLAAIHKKIAGFKHDNIYIQDARESSSIEKIELGEFS